MILYAFEDRKVTCPHAGFGMVVPSRSDCEIIKLPCRLITWAPWLPNLSDSSQDTSGYGLDSDSVSLEEPEERSDVERFNIILGSESSGDVFWFCFDISVFVFIFFFPFAEMQK
ncbi:unnamed protein product [Boreogadus saida]